MRVTAAEPHPNFPVGQSSRADGINFPAAVKRTASPAIRRLPTWPIRELVALGTKAESVLDEKVWLDESHELAKAAAYAPEVLDALRIMEASGGDVEEIGLSEAYLKAAAARPRNGWCRPAIGSGRCQAASPNKQIGTSGFSPVLIAGPSAGNEPSIRAWIFRYLTRGSAQCGQNSNSDAQRSYDADSGSQEYCLKLLHGYFASVSAATVWACDARARAAFNASFITKRSAVQAAATLRRLAANTSSRKVKWSMVLRRRKGGVRKRTFAPLAQSNDQPKMTKWQRF